MAHKDILIVGAGPTGLALAVALAQAERPAVVVDARTADDASNDRRILALSQGSRQILERLGVWQQIEATPIATIRISQQGGFGRTLLRAADYGLTALGYVAAASSLAAALARRLAALGLAVRHECRVTNLAAGADDVVLSLAARDAAPLTARLVALAEGAVSGQDEHAITTRDYHQHAVICTAHPAAPHSNMAYERFTPHGPLALLPFGPDYAVVFTVAADKSDELLGLDDAAFVEHLQRSIGSRVRLLTVSARARYPLQLRFRRKPAGSRTVWLGNAAQTLHPVAGQGFNLALRDVWELAQTLVGAGPNEDPGAAALLARYARARRLDRIGTIGFTDALIRVFGNDLALWRVARGGGLAALDLLPPLKHFVAKRMMFGARAWP